MSQRLLADHQSLTGDWVRAWDLKTNELETLVMTTPRADVRVSDDGARIFESFLTPAGELAVRVHTLDAGKVSSSEPMALALAAVSGDGSLVLDENLHRFTLAGEPDFDFSALLPEGNHRLEGHVAMSFNGNAIVTRSYSDETLQPQLLVVYEDGSVRALPGAPGLDGCCTPDARLNCGSYCGSSFSRDGRYLLSVRSGAQLSVWDLSTGTLARRLAEPSLRSASFAPGSNRLLIATEVGVTEQSIDGSEKLAWSLDGDRPFVVGPNAVLGVQAGALVVASREQTLGRWWQPRPTWEASEVAVTDDAAFAFAADDQLPNLFSMLVARYVPNHAGPTATLRAAESQSEWNGQILLAPDEQRVAVVFPDSIRILDATTLAPLTSLPTGAGAIAWSPDGKYLVATPDLHYRDADRSAYVPTKTLTFWNATSGKLEASFATPTYARGVAFSADGSKIVGSGRELKLPEPEPGGSASEQTVAVFAPVGDPVSFSIDVLTGAVSVNDLGEQIGWTRELVATERGVFRVSTGEQVSAFAGWGAPELPNRVVFSPDASVGLAVFADSLAPAQPFGVLDAHELTSAPFPGARTGLALSRGGRRVAAGDTIYCASSP